jgi:hypothetical protein
MTYRAPHKGVLFRNDNHTVWDIMYNICGQHESWIYTKSAQKAKYGIKAYELLLHHYLGTNNGGNTMSAAETKLASTLYNGEKKRFTWET